MKEELPVDEIIAKLQEFNDTLNHNQEIHHVRKGHWLGP